MKKIKFKIALCEGKTLEREGYLFEEKGIKLVAHRCHKTECTWRVSEYHTGMNIPGVSTSTRKTAISYSIDIINKHLQKLNEKLPNLTVINSN